MNMFASLGELSDLAPAALAHIASIENLLTQIRDQTSERQPFLWGFDDGGTAPGGAAFVLGATRIPVGKRFSLQRVSSIAPAASGALAIYASPSAAQVGGSLREVIANPVLYADAVNGTTMIRGGEFLVAVFNAVAAGGGICSVRYEGILYDDYAPGDLAH